jgi:gamma-glutamylcyclotransferase (GGCT)/AIG2-like uncharacterized protein YtfP
LAKWADQEFPMLKAAFGQSSANFAYGNIYQLTNPSAAFHLIDPFEKFDPTHELKDNMFIRNCVQVEVLLNKSPDEAQKVDAWLYVYNKHKPELFINGTPIPAGYWQSGEAIG